MDLAKQDPILHSQSGAIDTGIAKMCYLRHCCTDGFQWIEEDFGMR